MTLRKILSFGVVALFLLCGQSAAGQTAAAKSAAAQTGKPAPDNLFAEGYALLQAGDAQPAAAKFEAGLKTSPQNPLAHFFLGKAYYTLEKYDLAKTHLSKSLEIDPTNKFAGDAKALLQKIAEAEARVNAENSLWASAESSKNKYYYQSYLQQFPKGKHAAEAQTALTSIAKDEARKAAEAAAQAEDAAWKEAQQGGRGAAKAYLQQYPNGRYVAAANSRLSVPAIEPQMVPIPGKNYALGKYLVTQAEWDSVMDTDPSQHHGPNLPVDDVSWDDVQQYLSLLSQQTGKPYRLPTGEEWKYACHGGKNHKYCGGDDANAVAWYAPNSGDTTHPVGQKQPNGYGLYDMNGNVEEWTSGCMFSFQALHRDCTDRMLKGGSWRSSSRELATSYLSVGEEGSRAEVGSGVRVARTIP